MKKNPLGGNLGKLSDVAKLVVKPTAQADKTLKLNKIYVVPQVRTVFENLDSLAASIREFGIIEPLVVHEEPGGRNRLIIGERRYRAAPLADLDEVPVIVKKGLSEEEIRGLQVTENNERDDLKPYEKIMGVIEDVEKFGVQAAMKIWNVKSEGWISKRVAVKRYLPVTLSILKDALSGDLEILHSINKIEEFDTAAASDLRAQLERGESLHRDTVRTRLSLMELQRSEASQRSASPAVVVPAGGAGDHDNVSLASDGSREGDHDAPPLPAPGAEAATQKPAPGAEAAHPQSTMATVTKLPVKLPKNKPVPDAAAVAERERTIKGERLYEQRAELFEYGRDNEDSFNNLQALMSELGHSADEGEWAMWVGFQDMVLPMLDRLGDARSKAYLRRLLGDLKQATPAGLWQSLHPGADLNDGTKRGEMVPPMPAGWKF